MASYNEVILLGRLTRDPEVKYTPSGTQLTRFSLAVDRPSKEKITDFFDCTAWNKIADVVATYCKKGMLILVEGQININKVEDKKYTNINVASIQMLGGNGSASAASDTEKKNDVTEITPDDLNEWDDDLPF